MLAYGFSFSSKLQLCPWVAFLFPIAFFVPDVLDKDNRKHDQGGYHIPFTLILTLLSYHTTEEFLFILSLSLCLSYFEQSLPT